MFRGKVHFFVEYYVLMSFSLVFQWRGIVNGLILFSTILTLQGEKCIYLERWNRCQMLGNVANKVENIFTRAGRGCAPPHECHEQHHHNRRLLQHFPAQLQRRKMPVTRRACKRSHQDRHQHRRLCTPHHRKNNKWITFSSPLVCFLFYWDDDDVNQTMALIPQMQRGFHNEKSQGCCTACAVRTSGFFFYPLACNDMDMHHCMSRLRPTRARPFFSVHRSLDFSRILCVLKSSGVSTFNVHLLRASSVRNSTASGSAIAYISDR